MAGEKLKTYWWGIDRRLTRNHCGVFVSDRQNNKIHIQISYLAFRQYNDPNDTYWEWHVNANDQGKWLCVESGYCYYDGDTNQLFLVNSDDEWGVRFDDFKMAGGNYVRMEGSTGTVLQPWVLALVPGNITWEAHGGWVKL